MNDEQKKAEIREYQRRWREKNKGYHAAYQAKRKSLWFAENGPCKSCGSWSNLEVDHVDPKTKVTHNVWCWPEPRRLVELAKCQVLCSECHTRKTIADLTVSNRERYIARGLGKKLSKQQALAVLRLNRKGICLSEIATQFDISQRSVRDIIAGRTWSWLDREGAA